MTDQPASQATGSKGISDAQVIEALRKNGGVISLAAQALGVRRQSLSERVNANPALKAARDEADEDVTDIAQAVVVEAIVKGKDRKLAQWWLERRGRNRGFGNQTAHSNPDGTPLFDIEAVLQSLTDEQLNRLDAAAAGAAGSPSPDAEPT